MNHTCQNCHVHVEESLSHCPLCGTKVATIDSPHRPLLYPPPPFKLLKKKEERLLFKWSLFLSLVITFLGILANILWSPTIPWMFYIVWALLFTWLLVRHTILSRATLGQKIYFQGIVIGLLLSIIDYLTQGNGWSITYGIPWILATHNTVMFILLLSTKSVWKNDFIRLLVMSLLGLILFWFIKENGTIIWPNYVMLGVSMSVIMATLAFKWHSLMDIVKRFFHA